MILQLAALLFSATGVFTGTAVCEKLSDGVDLRMHIYVESTDPHVPVDSISKSLGRLSDSVRKLSLKSTGLTLGESSEGISRPRESKSDNPPVYYASKEIKATSRNFEEAELLLRTAAEHRFQLTGSARFFVDALDSLNDACIDKATRNAVERADIARKSIGGKSMTILKITDSESFHLYTSDDTQAPGEQVDGFFSKTGSFGSAYGKSRSGASRVFYRLSPEPIRLTTSVKVLVDIPVGQ